MNHNDTIAAICSGAGGAVAVIRISGKDALQAAARAWSAPTPLTSHSPRTLVLGTARPLGMEIGEPALAVHMPGPKSYTGEDVVEIHAHGGNLNARLLLHTIIASGHARHAEPGEFTYRAFLNGKLDLTQAEAVADLIASHSARTVAMAERQMGGALGTEIRGIRGTLLELLSDGESRTDFPEEGIGFEKAAVLVDKIKAAVVKLQTLHDTHHDGAVLREGVRIVIAGRPNSGKSSLLNLLLGYERAITSDIPGTTRDTIEEDVTLRGIPVTLVDTAGIREAEDAIEAFGIERTRKSIESSQIVIWLLDATSVDHADELSELVKGTRDVRNVIAAWNKIDLYAPPPSELPPAVGIKTVRMSAVRRLGVEELLDALEQNVWGKPHHETPQVAVSSRHAGLLAAALEALPEAADLLFRERWELAVVPLRAAITALGDIIGESASFDIYDTIFSKFCIGK